jgi:hypothetical protein
MGVVYIHGKTAFVGVLLLRCEIEGEGWDGDILMVVVRLWCLCMHTPKKHLFTQSIDSCTPDHP